VRIGDGAADRADQEPEHDRPQPRETFADLRVLSRDRRIVGCPARDLFETDDMSGNLLGREVTAEDVAQATLSVN
jgi:hypothetical protein